MPRACRAGRMGSGENIRQAEAAMTLTIDLSSLLPVQRIAPASHLSGGAGVADPGCRALLQPRPRGGSPACGAPGQSCQEKLAAAEAALNARERGGEVSPATP